jgi:hypothetical protein
LLFLAELKRERERRKKEREGKIETKEKKIHRRGEEKNEKHSPLPPAPQTGNTTSTHLTAY